MPFWNSMWSSSTYNIKHTNRVFSKNGQQYDEGFEFKAWLKHNEGISDVQNQLLVSGIDYCRQRSASSDAPCTVESMSDGQTYRFVLKSAPETACLHLKSESGPDKTIICGTVSDYRKNVD